MPARAWGHGVVVIGVLWVIAAPLVFIAGLVALIRPLPKLGLKTRLHAAGAILLSLFLLGFGVLMLPPVQPHGQPEQPPPPAPVPPAKSGPAPATPVPAVRPARSDVFDMSGADFIARVNLQMMAMELPLYERRNTTRVEAGTNEGGHIISTCAASQACLLIEETPDSQLLSATFMGGADGSPDSAVTLLANLMGPLKAVEPDGTDMSGLLSRGLRRLDQGSDPQTEEFGDACVTITGGSGLGVWEVLSPQPCTD